MQQAEYSCWLVHDGFLIVLLIGPENEGDVFLGNVD
jgi:hypothetical protein